jgi:ribosomal protein S12 methylthiotransferase accessory factor
MFCVKHISENLAPAEAFLQLSAIDARLPRKYFVRFHMGLCRLKGGDPEAGLALFRQALELQPDAEEAPTVYSYMGVALKELERYDEAQEVLRRGAQLDPERTDIHNLMGFCHYKRGDYAQAVAAFQRVLDLDPASAIDHANLGVNYQALGERDQAAVCYRTALSLDPGIDFARRNLEALCG